MRARVTLTGKILFSVLWLLRKLSHSLFYILPSWSGGVRSLKRLGGGGDVEILITITQFPFWNSCVYFYCHLLPLMFNGSYFPYFPLAKCQYHWLCSWKHLYLWLSFPPHLLLFVVSGTCDWTTDPSIRVSEVHKIWPTVWLGWISDLFEHVT